MKGTRLGPDLAAKREGVTDVFLVESILYPSKSIRESPRSAMPPGLVNQLVNRQQFLDMVRFLTDIHTGGPSRLTELKAGASP